MKDVLLVFLFGPPAFITWGVLTFFFALLFGAPGIAPLWLAITIMVIVFAINPNTI